MLRVALSHIGRYCFVVNLLLDQNFIRVENVENDCSAIVRWNERMDALNGLFYGNELTSWFYGNISMVFGWWWLMRWWILQNF